MFMGQNREQEPRPKIKDYLNIVQATEVTFALTFVTAIIVAASEFGEAIPIDRNLVHTLQATSRLLLAGGQVALATLVAETLRRYINHSHTHSHTQIPPHTHPHTHSEYAPSAHKHDAKDINPPKVLTLREELDQRAAKYIRENKLREKYREELEEIGFNTRERNAFIRGASSPPDYGPITAAGLRVMMKYDLIKPGHIRTVGEGIIKDVKDKLEKHPMTKREFNQLGKNGFEIL
jgi:hypothetical protein